MTASLYSIDDKTPIGQTVIGKTVYLVYRLPVTETARGLGVENQFALIGPRGAQFFVVDHGPKYRLNGVTLGAGRHIAPRQMRGLTREAMAAFGVRGV